MNFPLISWFSTSPIISTFKKLKNGNPQPRDAAAQYFHPVLLVEDLQFHRGLREGKIPPVAMGDVTSVEKICLMNSYIVCLKIKMYIYIYTYEDAAEYIYVYVYIYIYVYRVPFRFTYNTYFFGVNSFKAPNFADAKTQLVPYVALVEPAHGVFARFQIKEMRRQTLQSLPRPSRCFNGSGSTRVYECEMDFYSYISFYRLASIVSLWWWYNYI